MNDWRAPDDDPTAQQRQDALDNYGYGHEGPGPLGSGGVFGWLGRSVQRRANRGVRRWAYWNLPGFRGWLRYRQAGPLGRVGCVIQLLIQVAVLTVMVMVLLQFANASAIMQNLLAEIQGIIP